MGKNIIVQKRGRGSPTYTSPGHRFVGAISHRTYDEKERAGLIKGRVADLIHCPGHSAPLAEVIYEDKEKILMSAPITMKVGKEISSGTTAEAQIGNTLPLKNIPEGTPIFNLELMPGDGGKLVRAAGSFAKIISKTDAGVTVELPSKKQKMFNCECRATIGVISGGGMHDKPYLKAGSKMHKMRAKNKLYPRTSGVAMNAVNHPFGSGRGRHVGKPKTVSRHAPPGRKVGLIASKRTGKRS